MSASPTYVCPIEYGSERQVHVHGIPGLNYLPCIPMVGSTTGMTRIPNGTFIRFMNWKQLGQDEDTIVWEFQLSEMPAVHIYVSPDALANNWLWKAKRMVKPVLRRGY